VSPSRARLACLAAAAMAPACAGLIVTAVLVPPRGRRAPPRPSRGARNAPPAIGGWRRATSWRA